MFHIKIMSRAQGTTSIKHWREKLEVDRGCEKSTWDVGIIGQKWLSPEIATELRECF